MKSSYSSVGTPSRSGTATTFGPVRFPRPDTVSDAAREDLPTSSLGIEDEYVGPAALVAVAFGDVRAGADRHEHRCPVVRERHVARPVASRRIRQGRHDGLPCTARGRVATP